MAVVEVDLTVVVVIVVEEVIVEAAVVEIAEAVIQMKRLLYLLLDFRNRELFFPLEFNSFKFRANAQFINDVFSTLGEIEAYPDGKPKIKIYDDHGVSKGECTITFRSEEIAQRVIDTYNGTFPHSNLY
jgi:hypothetical protein